MKTLDEIYSIVEESSHETAFNRGEVEAIYNIMSQKTEPCTIVEIGIEFGRSTSVFAEFAKEYGHRFTAIDAWIGEYSYQARQHVLSQMNKHDWHFRMINADSKDASELLKGILIDVLHIDGGHEYEEVLLDCELWCPRVVDGGYVFFDDYGHDSLPGVFKAVSEYVDFHDEFKFIGRYGNKLGVFQKI